MEKGQEMEKQYSGWEKGRENLGVEHAQLTSGQLP